MAAKGTEKLEDKIKRLRVGGAGSGGNRKKRLAWDWAEPTGHQNKMASGDTAQGRERDQVYPSPSVLQGLDPSVRM